MANEIGNGVKGKYMENMDYTIKNIDKLEDLNGFEWEYQGKEFFFRIYTLVDEYTLALAIKKFKDYKTGEEEEKNLIHFSLRNLTELEFYGLKVILNEKPMLTRKEWDILECMDEDIWIARNKDGTIVAFTGIPEVDKMQWAVSIPYSAISLRPEMFPFITWESGKAWSKSELMELEVVE